MNVAIETPNDYETRIQQNVVTVKFLLLTVNNAKRIISEIQNIVFRKLNFITLTILRISSIPNI